LNLKDFQRSPPPTLSGRRASSRQTLRFLRADAINLIKLWVDEIQMKFITLSVVIVLLLASFFASWFWPAVSPGVIEISTFREVGYQNCGLD
jgi:hypothetical protein